MKKSKRIIGIVTSTIMLTMSLGMFSGCGSKTNTSTAATPTPTQAASSQTKVDAKTAVSELVKAGTLTQAQADKINAILEKNPEIAPGPNNPLEPLITDGTITEDQEHALFDKILGGAPAGMKNGGGGGAMAAPDTSSIKTKYLDVAYASKSASEKLDIYLPNSGNGPFPVIVAIHGGAFKSGDKASGELNGIIKALDRGYAVVSVNYRLSSEAKFPAQINDIKAAIRFLRANASKYKLNGNKIATWGGSAGGDLSALAGTTGGVKALEDDSLGNANESDKVQATVDWFGPIYFSKMDAQFAALGVTPVGVTNQANSPESAYLGKTIGSTEAEALVKQASPETYVSSDDPAFYIQHGTADKNIPITQSINFSEKLKAAIGSSKVIFEKIEGAGHGGTQFDADENVKKVLDFLDKYMK